MAKRMSKERGTVSYDHELRLIRKIQRIHRQIEDLEEQRDTLLTELHNIQGTESERSEDQ